MKISRKERSRKLTVGAMAGAGMLEYLLILGAVSLAGVFAMTQLGSVARQQTGNMAKELAGEKANLGGSTGTNDPGSSTNGGDTGGTGGTGSTSTGGGGAGSDGPGEGSSGGGGSQSSGGSDNGGGGGSSGSGGGSDGSGAGGSDCAHESEKEIQKEVLLHLEGNDSEGNYAYVYLDIVNKPTVGVGFLITSPENAATYPFYKKDGTKASAKEIKDMLATVESHSQSERCLVGIYKDCKTAKAYGKYSKMRLKQADINKIGMNKLSDFGKDLENVYSAYDSYPVNVKLALYDMIYNLGKRGVEEKFENFTAAIRAEDWGKAAKESYRSQVSSTRNEYVKNLLLKAAVSGCEVAKLAWVEGFRFAGSITSFASYPRNVS